MKTNKFFILLIIFVFAISFSLVGCGSSDTPTPSGDDSAAEEPAPSKTYVAELPEKQLSVDMIVPNLEGKVKSGEMSQERMDEIIQQVGDGSLSIDKLQEIMMGKSN